MTDLPAYVTEAEVTGCCALLQLQATSVCNTEAQRLRASRLRLLVRFLWLTGARISEALAVTVGDLDGHACVARLATLKRRKKMRRAVPLNGDALVELGQMVRDLGLSSGDRLWTWSRNRAFELIQEALMAAGVEKARAHPHVLRHGTGVALALAGTPLPLIQQMLGHSSATTTSVYLQMTGSDLRRYTAAVLR